MTWSCNLSMDGRGWIIVCDGGVIPGGVTWHRRRYRPSGEGLSRRSAMMGSTRACDRTRYRRSTYRWHVYPDGVTTGSASSAWRRLGGSLAAHLARMRSVARTGQLSLMRPVNLHVEAYSTASTEVRVWRVFELPASVG
jgi:hypothetical protein